MKTMMKNSNLMTRAALTLLVMMLTATTAWAETVYNISYIDADGNPAECIKAAVVTADMGGTSESKFEVGSGWFYVRNSVTLDGAYCTSTSVQNIILGDGATLTINGRFRFSGAPVNIYCQNGGTGRLIVNGSSYSGGIFTVPRSQTLTINGGTVEVTNTASVGHGFSGNLVMNGGTASFTSKEGINNYAIYGNVTLNGGTFTATSGSLVGVCSGTMRIADGKYFIDGSGDGYTGTLNDEQKKALSGKTLTTTTQTEYIQYSLGAGNDGSASKPYTISNANGWNAFCLALQDNDTWNRFTDKTVKLGADITVTRMAGSSDHEFCGTFDGDHHTLTVQYGTADAPIEQQQFVAPFVETARNSSPVFRNLTIDGNIYVKYADSSVEPGVGGLIGHLFGNVTVEHCTSKVVINSNKDRVGGFVGLCEYAVTFTDCKSSASVSSSIGNISGFVGWSRASAYTIAFEGCLFNGKLLQLNGTGGSGGCFVGWKGDAKTVNINNCLVAPATLAEGESMASSGSATFCRQHNDKLPAEIKNSYYTTAFGTAQGTQVHSIKAGKGVSVAMAGNVINEYETSGITFYNTGIMCDGKLYAVKDDVVSLSLSHEDQEGYALTGYEAKDSLQNTFALNADGANYKLTMPDDDVTVTANVVVAYLLTLPDGMEVVSATPAAIDGKYKEGTTIQFKVKSEDYVLDGDVMNGDDVLTAGDDGIYTVTVGNADITITASFIVTLSGDMSYTAQNGDVLRGLTHGTVRIADGASITLNDVTINGGIVCLGTATIILVGENSVTGLDDMAGIQVGSSGTTLTIKGNGSLAANGGYGSAGIGTGYVYDETVTFGDITIEGGSITANGGDFAAGIGTGFVVSGTVTLGDITIKGGSITANGDSGSAGIGTGCVDGGGIVTFSDITIEGGIIMANGGDGGAGIGTGCVFDGNATLGDITIKGGSITANGGFNGAGIGTGRVGDGTVILGNITIMGGSITANGYEWSAGIGTGFVWNGSATLGTLTIYDDIDLVDATGNNKSGISDFNIVYKHGESDVSGNASDYFDIINSFSPEEDKQEVAIESKKHAITLVNDGQHGTVTVVAKAMSGESVTIIVTPDSGYMLDTIEVKDANGNEVSLNDMSFIMPDSNVTITVTWKLAGVKGDVNRDGNVDISDVVALVNIILNSSSDHQAEADLNNDGNIDISDVVALVNIILGQ